MMTEVRTDLKTQTEGELEQMIRMFSRLVLSDMEEEDMSCLAEHIKQLQVQAEEESDKQQPDDQKPPGASGQQGASLTTTTSEQQVVETIKLLELLYHPHLITTSKQHVVERIGHLYHHLTTTFEQQVVETVEHLDHHLMSSRWLRHVPWLFKQSSTSTTTS